MDVSLKLSSAALDPEPIGGLGIKPFSNQWILPFGCVWQRQEHWKQEWKTSFICACFERLFSTGTAFFWSLYPFSQVEKFPKQCWLKFWVPKWVLRPKFGQPDRFNFCWHHENFRTKRGVFPNMQIIQLHENTQKNMEKKTWRNHIWWNLKKCPTCIHGKTTFTNQNRKPHSPTKTGRTSPPPSHRSLLWSSVPGRRSTNCVLNHKAFKISTQNKGTKIHCFPTKISFLHVFYRI